MVALPAYADLVQSLDSLDDILLQKVRLGIMSVLMACGDADFRFLRETLGVTDGNLSIHLTKLEEAGYIVSAKEFVRKKPHTTYAPTDSGRAAFQTYLARWSASSIQRGRARKCRCDLRPISFGTCFWPSFPSFWPLSLRAERGARCGRPAASAGASGCL